MDYKIIYISNFAETFPNFLIIISKLEMYGLLSRKFPNKTYT